MQGITKTTKLEELTVTISMALVQAGITASLSRGAVVSI